MNSRSRSISVRAFGSLRIMAAAALLLNLLGGCSGGGGADSSPVAVNDTYTSNPGQLSITVGSPGVLGNDVGSGLTAEIVAPPTNHSGTFTLNANGSFTYTLRSTATATTDSFTYRARNGTSVSAAATVTINITPPVATNDTFSVNRNSSVSGNVLTNTPADTPASGVTVELVPGSGPSHHQGSFSVNASTGAFTYTHNGDSAIVDSFRYRTKVGAIYSNEATVTININQPPVANNACTTITDGTTSLPVNLATSVSDPNGVGPLTFTIATQAANGTITPAFNNTGLFTYVPNIPTGSVGRRGMDRFTFTVTDAGGQTSSPATVSILNGGRVRIMPLGDSITQGITVGDPSGSNDQPPIADRVGYRKPLYEALVNDYPVDFVGSQSAGGSLLADADHEGHPGWCDDNNPYCNPSTPPGSTIADSVTGFLNNRPPDIILLHIGTNQFDPNSAGTNTILNNISTWATQNYPVKVFLARIIPTRTGVFDVQAFNDNVNAIAGPRAGVDIFRVDQQAEFWVGPTGTDRNIAQPALMADDYHPNADGYQKMADRWRTDMLSAGVLPVCQ